MIQSRLDCLEAILSVPNSVLEVSFKPTELCFSQRPFESLAN